LPGSRNSFAPAEFGNAGFAAQTIEHDAGLGGRGVGAAKKRKQLDAALTSA
jgi:hypothetical protein